MRKSLPYALLAAAVLLWALCLPCLAAPQPYVLDLRSGGAPATGLASQLNAGTYQSATALTGAAVTTNLPTWVESTLIPGTYGCTYDAAANGPLIFGQTLTGVSDPNEANVRVFFVADPALIASGAPVITALHADGQWHDVHAYTSGNKVFTPATGMQYIYDVVNGVPSGTAQIGEHLTIVSGVTTQITRTQ